MCSPTGEQVQPHPADNDENESNAWFPWHLGACDAHCHPTDTMASIASIASMRARMLTIMATRSEDQDLVSSVAAQHGIKSRADLVEATGHIPCQVVPAYGWHPWFSHQFYADTDTAKESTFDPSGEIEAEKTKHYTAVLSSTPDAAFIASLPNPRPLSQFIAETRERLLADPTALVGEIGLDKAFRLPQGWDTNEAPKRDEGLTPGGREGRKLSPHRVKISHQETVLKAQLRLAGELGRPVSIHDVGAHGGLFDVLSSLWKGFEKPVISRRQRRMVAEGAEDFSSDEDLTDDESGKGKKQSKAEPYQPRPYPPRICLHSYSGSSETLRQYLDPSIPTQIYFSFSMAVNLSKDGQWDKFAEVIGACPDNKLLVESDLHVAGGQMDESLAQIYREVCNVKGWVLTEGMERIRKNYEEYLFGIFD
ncbi:Cut9-interacting protein scn1 [Echria macrotheca]|uniref:Cut9-interacting protein scn1 n=1 Tax=Echria macrotheca TaxID=438768 RepID=A0AAJ0F5J1_9PEZI|nr:Cut9-interacting protein scn1 [Echria macrotheca]